MRARFRWGAAVVTLPVVAIGAVALTRWLGFGFGWRLAVSAVVGAVAGLLLQQTRLRLWVEMSDGALRPEDITEGARRVLEQSCQPSTFPDYLGAPPEQSFHPVGLSELETTDDFPGAQRSVTLEEMRRAIDSLPPLPPPLELVETTGGWGLVVPAPDRPRGSVTVRCTQATYDRLKEAADRAEPMRALMLGQAWPPPGVQVVVDPDCPYPHEDFRPWPQEMPHPEVTFNLRGLKDLPKPWDPWWMG